MAKTYVQINTTKSKEDMYNWIKEIFVQTNDINNFNEEYEYYSIGVKYNNSTTFNYNILDAYLARHYFYNYFVNNNIEDITYMYVYNYEDSIIYIYGGLDNYDIEYNENGKAEIPKLTKSIDKWFYTGNRVLNFERIKI